MTTTNTISILIAERCIEALDREEDGASVTIIGTVTNENIAAAASLLFAGKHCYLAPAPGAANSDRISPEAQASLIEKDAPIAENSLQILSLSSTVAARNKVIAENESRIAHLESEATACRMTKADAPEDEGEIAELRALLIEMVKRASDPDLGRGVFGARLMLQQAIRDAEEKLGIAEADAPEFEPTETAGRLFVNGLRDRVGTWVVSTFGEAALADRKERAARMVEEAIELAQAEGLGWADAERIAVRVYSRPAGETRQELGGLMVTALALCAGLKIDLLCPAIDEIERIEKPEVIAKIRAKQEEKAKAGTARSFAMAPEGCVPECMSHGQPHEWCTQRREQPRDLASPECLPEKEAARRSDVDLEAMSDAFGGDGLVKEKTLADIVPEWPAMLDEIGGLIDAADKKAHGKCTDFETIGAGERCVSCGARKGEEPRDPCRTPHAQPGDEFASERKLSAVPIPEEPIIDMREALINSLAKREASQVLPAEPSMSPTSQNHAEPENKSETVTTWTAGLAATSDSIRAAGMCAPLIDIGTDVRAPKVTLLEELKAKLPIGEVKSDATEKAGAELQAYCEANGLEPTEKLARLVSDRIDRPANLAGPTDAAKVERSSFAQRERCSRAPCEKMTLRRVPSAFNDAAHAAKSAHLAPYLGKPLCFGCEIELGAVQQPEVPRCAGMNKAAGVPCTAEGKVQRGEKWFCGRCDPEKPPRTAKLALAPAPTERA